MICSDYPSRSMVAVLGILYMNTSRIHENPVPGFYKPIFRMKKLHLKEVKAH